MIKGTIVTITDGDSTITGKILKSAILDDEQELYEDSLNCGEELKVEYDSVHYIYGFFQFLEKKGIMTILTR